VTFGKENPKAIHFFGTYGPFLMPVKNRLYYGEYPLQVAHFIFTQKYTEKFKHLFCIWWFNFYTSWNYSRL